MIALIYDENIHDDFYPHTLMRPMWTIMFGCFEMHERICYQLKDQVDRVYFLASKKHFNYAREIYGDNVTDEIPINDDVLFVNSMSTDLSKCMSDATTSFRSGNRIVAAYVKKHDLKRIVNNNGVLDGLDELESVKISQEIFPRYIWDIPLQNGNMISSDFSRIKVTSPDKSVVISGDAAKVSIAPSAELEPFVSICTQKGPVIISENAKVSSFSRIEGPCFIGEDCQIFRANIREGCSFGRACRLGGEIEDSVFHSYSNKYHDGFIGHAYIGSWVNLGAMTTNSDLKNDYSDVIVRFPRRAVNTNSPKVGAIIGDFVKCSIGTLINTGSVIGSCSSTVSSGRMTPSHIPPFTMFIKNEMREVKGAEAVILTAKVQMGRRKRNFSSELETLMRDIFIDTSDNRAEESEAWNENMK